MQITDSQVGNIYFIIKLPHISYVFYFTRHSWFTDLLVCEKVGGSEARTDKGRIAAVP